MSVQRLTALAEENQYSAVSGSLELKGKTLVNVLVVVMPEIVGGFQSHVQMGDQVVSTAVGMYCALLAVLKMIRREHWYYSPLAEMKQVNMNTKRMKHFGLRINDRDCSMLCAPHKMKVVLQTKSNEWNRLRIFLKE